MLTSGLASGLTYRSLDGGTRWTTILSCVLSILPEITDLYATICQRRHTCILFTVTVGIAKFFSLICVLALQALVQYSSNFKVPGLMRCIARQSVILQ
ncbi:hypothetical protein B0H19DRAFT_1174501 [Mycena capillaripes]|nr:hypothetical protein B0H19DRAFT_1174501 [Mycena capillaripes]